jgi:SAM-dependent methyltransferase
MSTIWHDLECGGYNEDLPVWRSLATEHGDPILEVGAGTGRVSLELARDGHRVTALDLDRGLLDELERRADGLRLQTAHADAREFELGRQFALCLVPMQTIQLFGGPAGRAAFLEQARRHLTPGGVLAAAITTRFEIYELAADGPGPVPDMCERDGVVYASQPTAVRAAGERYVLERRREVVAPDGVRTVESNAIELDRLTERELELEAEAQGFTPLARATIPATLDYVGSEVVILRA